MRIVDKIFNHSQIKKAENIVNEAKKLSDYTPKLSDEEILNEFIQIRNNYYEKSNYISQEPLVLALISEVFKRTLNIVPYDEQLICAVSLYQGFVCEMKTGEGKSIAAVIAAILCAVHGKVHITTVNDYLAKRDYVKMNAVFEKLGLVCKVNERSLDEKESLYQSDIVYSSSSELIFDYLRNELSPSDKKIVFPFDTAIIDEVDFVLLDNANSMFSISTGLNFLPNLHEFSLAKEICSSLRGMARSKEDYDEDISESEDAHYIYYPHNKIVYLTDIGMTFIEMTFGIKNLTSNYLKLYRALIYTLEANLFYMNGREYVVENGKIVLVSQTNGRLLHDSQLDCDLHTAIELKENLNVTEKPLLSNSLSYQIFFTKYKKMVGMSGTVYEAKEEFEELFKVPALVVSTHNPNRRIDRPDLFFKTIGDKYDYLIDFLKNRVTKNQPVLIITGSERESFVIFSLLSQANIKANLLNAQNTSEEAELVKKAGSYGTITVSTNISGRGTDIVLDEKAQNSGGLFVIALNRSISKRIDNQARGRSGRQGDLGECIFLISMEDEIFKNIDEKQTERLERISDKLFKASGYGEDRKLEKLLDKIQNQLQADNCKTRKNIYTLDAVLENKRQEVYEWKEYLKGRNQLELTMEFIESKEFNENIFLELWREKSNSELDISNLKSSIQLQDSKLGETSLPLFCSLIDQIIDKEWLIFRRDLENIKFYLQANIREEKEVVQEYIKICSDQYMEFRQQVMNNILGYFLTAKVQSTQTIEKEA